MTFGPSNKVFLESGFVDLQMNGMIFGEQWL